MPPPPPRRSQGSPSRRSRRPFPLVVAIVGPTASRKTEWGKFIADKFQGEVISVDSRQVYRGLDIGSGKDKSFPQHLIDALDPATESVNAQWYQQQVYRLIDQLIKRGVLPILVGGTGMYLDAIFRGYRFPAGKRFKGEFAGKRTPPPYRFLIIAIEMNRAELYQRIDQRIEDRVASGMIDEVRTLRSVLSDERIDGFGLEYRYCLRYLKAQFPREAMIGELKKMSHTFARHQYNWLTRWQVRWLPTKEAAERLIKRELIDKRRKTA